MARPTDRRDGPPESPTSLWAPRGPVHEDGSRRPPVPPTGPEPTESVTAEPEDPGRFGSSGVRPGDPVPTGSPAPPFGPEARWSGPPSVGTRTRPPVADHPHPVLTRTGPPTMPPPARVAAADPPGAEPRPRRAFSVIVAFLAGMLVVGSAFAAYAFGERGTTESGSAGRTGGLDVRAVLDRAQPSVVSITTGTENSIFGGAGSGVVISADGLVLTNSHVVANARGDIRVRFNDGAMADGSIVGASTPDDLALIRVERDGLVAATLGSSEDLRVGDDVVAIGNALALGDEPSVTKGIVSAKNRSISDGEISLTNLIQTDAAINPGNSGGPLVNAAGEVVGINTAIIDGAQNVGFSIAIDKVRDLIPELEAGRSDIDPNPAVLGVKMLTVDGALDDEVRTRWDVAVRAGALIIQLDDGSPAAESGLQPGDVIVEIDGDPIRTNHDAVENIGRHDPGDEVRIGVDRAGDRRSFDVTLGPR